MKSLRCIEPRCQQLFTPMIAEAAACWTLRMHLAAQDENDSRHRPERR